MDNVSREVEPYEADAIQKYKANFGDNSPVPHITRWARVRLPNGQIARSAWKEEVKKEAPRTARNVQVCTIKLIYLYEVILIFNVPIQVVINKESYLAEVSFYMILRVGNTTRPAALVTFYGPPHKELYEASSKTYWTAQHLRHLGIRVIDIDSIQSVVMMAPDEQYGSTFKDGSEVDRWYLMEKPGIKIAKMAGSEEFMTEE